MGVVRREGDWRLEKRDDGIYEITHDGATEVKIVTSEYDPGIVDERVGTGVPVREVHSFSDAEELFEEAAENRHSSPFEGVSLPPGGISSTGDAELEHDSGIDGEGTLEELPPGGFALVLLAAGAIVVYSSAFTFGSLPLYVGIAMVVVGLAIFGWAGIIYKSKGASEAREFLTTIDENEAENSADDKSSDEPERTPPAPQTLKDDLYFDRADQKCEWCGERVDQPEVHHIVPRSEGGPNEPSNLIVLCPGCHAKADRGGISKTKLRSKVRRLSDPSSS